jgi:spermidine synthase
VAWDESRYQSLALVESAGQHTLYGNGEVLSTLPDPVGFEHLVHFVMAQKPRAHSALLIGGAVQGEGAELLKYPISRLVHVELDPAVGELLRKADPVTTARVASDPRLELVSGDAPRYAARCREKFDVVFVMAPQPSTAAANRFYTVEFYRDIRRVMGPSSFFYTSVVSSERMEFPAADIAASVYRTLRGVFGDVRVTAGSPTQFFAAIQRDVLTMDPGELAERSRTSSVSNTYFRPEYFMGADELDPAKIAFVEERLRSARGPLNSWDTPVTYFHAMRMWSRVSGPVPEKLLEVSSKGLRSLPLRSLLIAVACLLPVMGFLARPAGRNAWQGPLMLLALSITGGAGLAAELLSIHAVQGIFGYVYAQIGLIVAAFMAGLWAGAAISGSKPMSGLRGHVGLAASASLLCFVLWAIPLAARTACAGLAGPLSWVFVGVFYVIVLVGGLAVGAQFPLAAAIYASSRGCGPGHAAAMAEAADVAGAAAGGATVGILLLPALGMNGACSLAAAAELVALGAVAASFLSSRPRG